MTTFSTFKRFVNTTSIESQGRSRPYGNSPARCLKELHGVLAKLMCRMGSVEEVALVFFPFAVPALQGLQKRLWDLVGHQFPLLGNALPLDFFGTGAGAGFAVLGGSRICRARLYCTRFFWRSRSRALGNGHFAPGFNSTSRVPSRASLWTRKGRMDSLKASGVGKGCVGGSMTPTPHHSSPLASSPLLVNEQKESNFRDWTHALRSILAPRAEVLSLPGIDMCVPCVFGCNSQDMGSIFDTHAHKS